MTKTYPDVVLIVVDTLRKNYAISLENELEKIGFISYNNVIAPSPWTVPSHATILTGLYPIIHGAHETIERKGMDVKIKSSALVETLLSRILKRKGYKSFLVSANPFIRPELGFKEFDYFYEINFVPQLRTLSASEGLLLRQLRKEFSLQSRIDLAKYLVMNRHYRILLKATINYTAYRIGIDKIYYYLKSIMDNFPLDKGAAKILDKIEKILRSTEKPRFIFINFMEVHEPYCIKENDKFLNKLYMRNWLLNELDHKLLRSWKERYVNEVNYITRRIQELIQLLDEYNSLKESLIIITSDHGQLLGEHGKISHGIFLFDELLRVPLLIKYPEQLKLKIAHYVNKYISLTRLKKLIIKVLDAYARNKTFLDHELYTNQAYAESHGIHIRFKYLNEKTFTKSIKEVIDGLEKYRIAIYHEDFKGIFNVSDWCFEEIISYDPYKEVDKNIVEKMKHEIVKFLKLPLTLRYYKRR